MKDPISKFLRTLLALLLSSCAFAHHSEARIGESKQSIERRLFASGGIVYRDDETEANRRRGMPYLPFLEFLPNGADVRIYFKTIDGSRPQSSQIEQSRMPDGWDLHVIYVGGKSVLEAYRRSRGITEFELNAILAKQADGSFWMKVKPESMQPSILGYDLEREDKMLRAKRAGGNTMLFFDANIDEKLAALKESDLERNAPISVNGF